MPCLYLFDFVPYRGKSRILIRGVLLLRCIYMPSLAHAHYWHVPSVLPQPQYTDQRYIVVVHKLILMACTVQKECFMATGQY